MKKCKSILALVLALLMVCPFVVCAAEETTAETSEEIILSDVDKATTTGEAILNLVSLGIINGYPDGTFREENTITRAEFTVVITKFLNLANTITADAVTGFADLDNDSSMAWARPYVKIASDLGIIKGFEDGTFRAGDPVTYEQAVKMLVATLGYEVVALQRNQESGGTWSSGYIAVANEIGITKKTAVADVSQAATRGLVAILTNNSLNIDRLIKVGDNQYQIEEDSSALSTVHNKTKITGIVNGTYLTGIEEANPGLSAGQIMIDDEIYEIGFSGDATQFLGYKVTAYIEKQSNEDHDLVTSLDPVSTNKTLTIEYDFVEDANDDEISYLKTRTSTKAQEAKLDSPAIIYNGKLYEDYDLTDLKDDLKSGFVELICNDGDGKYEVVNITSYEILVVEKVDTTNSKIYLLYPVDGVKTIEVETEGSSKLAFSMTRANKEITLKDLAKWDVINLKRSPSTIPGRKVYEMIVTRKNVSGTVTSTDDSIPSLREIKNAEYHIAYNYEEYTSENKPQLLTGDTVQVYLDSMGRIAAAAENANTTTYQYGYILGARQDSDESNYPLDFWILNTKGQAVEYGTGTRITIDGERYQTKDEDILDILEETAEIANEDAPDVDNLEYHQLIRFSVGNDGLIDAIDTLAESTLGNDIEKDVPYPGEELTYKSSGRSFDGAFSVSSSTKIFFVPDNRTDTDDYAVFTYSDAFTDTREYHVEAYNLSSSNVAGAVIIYKKNDSTMFTSSSPMMIVDSIYEDLEGYTLSGYVNGSTNLTSVDVDESCDGIDDIEQGDIIRYRLDSSSKIAEIKLWLDASDPIQAEAVGDIDDAIELRILEINTKDSDDGESRRDTPNASFRLEYGTIVYVDTDDDKAFKISPTLITDDADMAMDGKGVVTYSINSNIKKFVYDSGKLGNNKLSTDGAFEELVGYDDFPNSPSVAVTYSVSGSIKAIYILN